MSRLLPLLVVTALLASGCGDETDDPGSSEPAALTSRAIAAVMLDHLSGDTTHRQATYVDEHSPQGLVGADFRYNGGGEDDGDLVEVTVHKGSADACKSDADCAELGDGVTLKWDEVEPEEDPGIVLVEAQRDGEVVSALVAGPEITGDPRDIELEPSVATLTKLVEDPRLRLRTDAATVAAGEDVDDWKGGEVDPASLEKVPNTDATVVTGWIWAYGDAWRYAGPSPYKKVFGADAIGGRVEVTGDMQIQKTGYFDALAAPSPPSWLTGGGCLDGYQCGEFHGVQVVWRPASGDDPGDAFLVHVGRGGETVAIHDVGNRIPDKASGAAWAAGLGLWSYDLTDPMSETRISLTTTREKFEQAEKRADG